MSPKKMLDFLLIVGKLKTEKRTGWVNNKVPQVESIADHMYRMAIMAFFIRDGTTNAQQASQIALVHDIAEALVGDITPPESSGVSITTKHQLESDAIRTISESLPKTLGNDLKELYNKYETPTTSEGQLCKQLDKLEMIIQAYEYEVQYPDIILSQFYDSIKKIKHPFLLEIADEVISRRKDLLNQRNNK